MQRGLRGVFDVGREEGSPKREHYAVMRNCVADWCTADAYPAAIGRAVKRGVSTVTSSVIGRDRARSYPPGVQWSNRDPQTNQGSSSARMKTPSASDAIGSRTVRFVRGRLSRS